MQFYIGTSGWYYEWNTDKTLDWYINHSNLNSIELNASFYRFPFANQIKSWARKGIKLRWSIKVNKLITHRYKFNEKAANIWKKFKDLFTPMRKLIDFYLFQIPPNFTDIEKVIQFSEMTGLKKKFALEIRNKNLLENPELCKKLQKNFVLVSVDSPDFKNKIFEDKIVYMRLHGRTKWYQHNYSDEELKEIATEITDLKPKKIYIYFNNNHNMLENAKTMFMLFTKLNNGENK
ncbi:MAG: hypothetical protein B6U88_02550 [Candidatus Aenigmarchaeota archaeon ex4484_56]|nr:MAG: hypothetical protein B6U88_02550 [Candidatus Aenigmarchaeota archaeon ex4484_56]